MIENSIINILLVEDNPGDARMIQEMLKQSQFEVKFNHKTKLSDITKQKYDLILLDLDLPDSEGLSTVLRVHELLPQVPIVVMTGFDNEELSLSAIQSGAQDYLVKSKTDSHTLLKTIFYALSRHKTLGQINVLNDTQREYWATHDVLTGLPNQHLLLETLEVMIQNSEVTKRNLAVAFLKFHEISSIVAKFGHHKKDELVKQISDILKALFPESDIIARYNENTFAFLFRKSLDTKTISRKISFIEHSLTKAFNVDGHEYRPVYNIGAAIFPFDGQNADELILSAQTALTSAMYSGMREHEIFSKTLSYAKKSDDELILYSDLEAAIEREEFIILYQPQVCTATQTVGGVEALLRWKHPKHGFVPPQKFIYMAEEALLISPLGEWVLESVVKQHQEWKHQAKGKLPLRVSVNVSVQQLHHDNFCTVVHNILNKYEIPSEQLELEVTESIFIDRASILIDKLHRIKRLGIQVAIDDFGKGYSALSYLRHLPVDRLKLDMDYVEKNKRDTHASVVVKSIIDLAHNLDLKVIAEGVEKAEQLEMLKTQGCDEVQGYYYSKPVEENHIAALISQGLKIKPGYF